MDAKTKDIFRSVIAATIWNLLKILIVGAICQQLFNYAIAIPYDIKPLGYFQTCIIYSIWNLINGSEGLKTSDFYDKKIHDLE